MRLFIDTNIFFDYVLGRPPHFASAKALIEIINKHNLTCATNPNNFSHSFHYLMKVRDDSFQVKYDLLNLLSTIECVDYDQTIVEKALRNGLPLDLEDGVTLELAIAYKAHYLITRDFSGFSNAPMKVISPAEFINIWEAS